MLISIQKERREAANAGVGFFGSRDAQKIRKIKNIYNLKKVLYRYHISKKLFKNRSRDLK